VEIVEGRGRRGYDIAAVEDGIGLLQAELESAAQLETRGVGEYDTGIRCTNPT